MLAFWLILPFMLLRCHSRTYSATFTLPWCEYVSEFIGYMICFGLFKFLDTILEIVLHIKKIPLSIENLIAKNNK